VRPATIAAPTQLMLNLVDEPSLPPIEVDATTLLQALADLLLEALGQQTSTETMGSGDEPEDHA
jgi:hypothetical protein